MVRTQIQLPDELYHRAKAFAAEREISLAEVTRRGIEGFLDRFPKPTKSGAGWKLPKVDAGPLKVPLEDLREYAREEEGVRGLKRP